MNALNRKSAAALIAAGVVAALLLHEPEPGDAVTMAVSPASSIDASMDSSMDAAADPSTGASAFGSAMQMPSSSLAQPRQPTSVDVVDERDGVLIDRTTFDDEQAERAARATAQEDVEEYNEFLGVPDESAGIALGYDPALQTAAPDEPDGEGADAPATTSP